MPLEVPPPVTRFGVKVRLLGVAGFTVSVPVLLPPFAVALICTAVVEATGAVTTVQVPLALPAGTVMLAGIDDTAEFPLTTLRLTTVSLSTARVNVTFPTLLAPPITELGVKATRIGVLGVTVSVAFRLPPFAVALT